MLAVDLPGRRSKPGDLRTLTIGECVESVVKDIESAGLADVVVVGHSIAGVTVPGVVARLGSPRVRELVLAAAMVPPEGKAIKDILTGPLRFARRNAKWGKHNDTPTVWTNVVYLNGVPLARAGTWRNGSTQNPGRFSPRACLGTTYRTKCHARGS